MKRVLFIGLISLSLLSCAGQEIPSSMPGNGILSDNGSNKNVPNVNPDPASNTVLPRSVEIINHAVNLSATPEAKSVTQTKTEKDTNSFTLE